ncbi:MAG: helix-turn-helix transcriptional regulator [Eubacteriales bacterium]
MVNMIGLYKFERPEYSLLLSGEKMRQFRLVKKLSVEDVRKYMKFESVQAIYKWEQGKCFPTVDNLFALAELYGVNPSELLVREPKTLQNIYSAFEWQKNLKEKYIKRLCLYMRKLNY